MIDSLRRQVGRAAPFAGRLADPDDTRAPLLLWGAVAAGAIALAAFAFGLVAPASPETRASPALPPPTTAFAAAAATPASAPEAVALRDLVDTYRTEAGSLLRLATSLRQDNDMLRSRLLAIETEVAGLNANSILKSRLDRVEQGITGLREQTVAATARSEAALRAAEVDRITTAAIGAPATAALGATPDAPEPPGVRVVGAPATAAILSAGAVLPIVPGAPDGAAAPGNGGAAALSAGAGAITADGLAAALPSALGAIAGPDAGDLPPPGLDVDALGDGLLASRAVTDPVVDPIMPVPAPRPHVGAAARSQFGLDVGGASDVSSARLVWAGLVRSQGALLSRLHPVASVRNDADGIGRLRIILGPFGDAADAAAACARLQAAGTACSPTLYAGAPLSP